MDLPAGQYYERSRVRRSSDALLDIETMRVAHKRNQHYDKHAHSADGSTKIEEAVDVPEAMHARMVLQKQRQVANRKHDAQFSGTEAEERQRECADGIRGEIDFDGQQKVSNQQQRGHGKAHVA